MTTETNSNWKIDFTEDFYGRIDRTEKSGIRTQGEYISYQPITIRNQALRITKVREKSFLTTNYGTMLKPIKSIDGYSLKYGNRPTLQSLSFEQVQNIVKQLQLLALEDEDTL